ncbi:type I restriction enzyme M protein [Mucilaginibacter terrae]|uniref:site-specific DNA-methyltransferase (adenine-specific) n=2 Tax=Mucilaginibacter terrae TaxID=1955052 RepID=A0ABU3GWW6_9SPHI|nr:type I restriction enzyme M protein [Mucilaginibacter terrae]
MRKDSGVDGDAQRISQMVWMLFLKIFSDKEGEWKNRISNYKSPIPHHLKWENWAVNNTKLTGEALIDFINQELFATLKHLDEKENEYAHVVKAVFEDTYNYMKNGTLFRQVVIEIDKINFSSSREIHVFNEIYETILKELQSAGSSGEYYTPRAVTQFMVEMTEPSKGQKILDPACGTGGFLTCSIDYIQAMDSTADIELLEDTVLGIEKKPLPHLLCTTNLMLQGFASPKIHRDNLLSKPYSTWLEDDQVDVIFSNPPFGGLEEDGTEDNFPINFRTKETSDLFVALIIKLLKKNGKAAIILPDGFLFGEGVRTRIKQELLDQCNLHTIVRLPNGVFSPYTNIKTNLLFFEKGKPTQYIWYFEHPLPPNQKSYNRSRPITLKEFEIEKTWWNKRQENDYSWKVSINDIKKRNYNLDISSPYFGEQEEKLNSDEIVLRLERSMQRSQELLSFLKIKF